MPDDLPTDGVDLTDEASEDPYGNLDFTDEPVSEERLETAGTIPYDPGRDREMIRGYLAIGILIILAVVVVGAFLTVWLDLGTREDLDLILTALLSPVVGLFGAVSGFYYGSRTSR